MINFGIISCDSQLTKLLVFEFPIKCVNMILLGVEILCSGDKETLAHDLQENRLVENGAVFL